MKTTRYGIDDRPIFVIDPSRCIGCEACVQACSECGTHRGQSLIHLERLRQRNCRLLAGQSGWSRCPNRRQQSEHSDEAQRQKAS